MTEVTDAAAAEMAAILEHYGDKSCTFIDEKFIKQAAFIKDPSRRKFAFCTRRAGKSEGAGRYLLKEAYENPGTQVLYVGLTRGSAKAIMWQPILKRLVREFGIDVRWNEVELTGHFGNGSLLRLTGADANDNERSKLLGGAYSLIVLDECASFRDHIRELVLDTLNPTLVDQRGTMVMCGTPSEVPAGYFYEVTTGKVPGWTGHSWNTYENPYVAENFTAEVADLKALDPDVETRPWFRRQYMGEWVTDSENLIYHFGGPQNAATSLPDGRWVFGLGIDLGWEDATSFVVAAWCETDPTLYILEAYKEPHMVFSAIDEKIKAYSKEYGTLAHIVIDNANKQGVEDMRARYGWNFQAAQKTGKNDYIGLMNSDLHNGQIKLLPDAEPLATEWGNLVWEKGKIPPREDPSCENHISDAALYVWRHAKHYLGQIPSDPEPKRGTREYANWQARQWEKEDYENMEHEQGKEWWE